jgi:hypothetical protein
MKRIIFILAVVLQITALGHADDLRASIDEIGSKNLVDKIKDVYNLSVETREDEICKNFILTESMKVARERRSRKTVQDSGVLNFEYTEIDVKKMSDVEIRDLYNILREKLPPDLNEEPLSKLREMPENEQILLAIRGITLITLDGEIKARNSAPSKNIPI